MWHSDSVQFAATAQAAESSAHFGYPIALHPATHLAGKEGFTEKVLLVRRCGFREDPELAYWRYKMSTAPPCNAQNWHPP